MNVRRWGRVSKLEKDKKSKKGLGFFFFFESFILPHALSVKWSKQKSKGWTLLISVGRGDGGVVRQRTQDFSPVSLKDAPEETPALNQWHRGSRPAAERLLSVQAESS